MHFSNTFGFTSTLWEVLNNAGIILLVQLLIILYLYVVGYLLAKCIRSCIPSSGTVIASGLAVVLFVFYYFNIANFSSSAIFLILLSAPLVAIIAWFLISPDHNLVKKQLVGCVRTVAGDCSIIFFTLLFTAQFLIVYGPQSPPVGGIGNNDIFSWALMTDTLVGAAQPANIIPNGAGYLERLKNDCPGTLIALAIFAKSLGQPTLLITPYFAIFVLSLISILTRDCVRFLFKTGNLLAVAITTLVVSGSFWFTVAHHGFYSQILGTAFLMALVYMCANASDEKNALSALQIIVNLTLLVGALLISYSSGALPLMSVAGIFCIMLGVLRWLFHQQIKQLSMGESVFLTTRPVMLLGASIVLACLLLPGATLNIITVISARESGQHGWPLPLLRPEYFASIPTTEVFPGLPASQMSWALFSLVALIVIGRVLVGAGRKGELASTTSAAAGLAFLAGVAAYLLYFYLRGPTYQAWKLASFMALPMGFSFWGCMFQFVSRWRKDIRYFDMLLPYLVFLLAVANGLYVAVQFRSSDVFDVQAVRNAQAIARTLKAKDTQDVILATNAYRETMLLLPFLSKEFHVYPLSRTYMDPTSVRDLPSVEAETTRVVFSKTEKVNHNQTTKFFDVHWSEVNEMTHSFANTSHNLIPINNSFGFAIPEHWATWTDGEKAGFDVEVPPFFLGKSLTINLKVYPFFHQKIAISLAGRAAVEYNITQATTLTWQLSVQEINDGRINVRIHIQSPIAPKDIDETTTDNRRLGIALISLSILSTPKQL